MRFTLAQLSQITSVAEHSSFSAAARALNVSQPSVSNNISDVEEALGKKLFSRSTRAVELTPFGKALMPSIEEVLNASERLKIEAAALINPTKKLLRIAFTPLIEIGRVNALCTPFRTTSPGVEIVFKECEYGSLEKRLKDEQVDLVCAHDLPKSRDFERCTLFEDPLHFVPPSFAKTTQARTLTLPEIAKHKVLLTMGMCGLAPATEQIFEANCIDVDYYEGRAISYMALQDWAELGLGGAIIPRSRIMGDAKQYPQVFCEGRAKSLKYEAVWLKSACTSDHLRDFFVNLPIVAKAQESFTADWVPAG